MNTFYWTIFLLLLSLFFTCGPLQPNSKEEDKDQLSRIFGGSLFDYFQNHNQALDIIEVLTQEGFIKKPATLIHIDTHSDMYRLSYKNEKSPSNFGQTFASYVNTLILEGTVAEIHWVLPDVSRTPENREILWNPETGSDSHFVLFNGPGTQTFYVDERDRDICYDKPDDYNLNPARYRKVMFHKVILEELELERSDRPVIVDIDADYFSNNGYDTANEMVVPYKEQDISRLLSTLENLGIRPILTMGSLSPEYTHEKDQLALERFFQEIGARTLKGDYLIGYKHHDQWGDIITGRNIPRQSKDLYRGIYELSYIDLRSNTPDYLTLISDTSTEYIKVNKRIQMLLGISEQKSAALLLNWDNEDGNRDSAVSYYQIEQNVQNSNGTPLRLYQNSRSPFSSSASLKKYKSISKEEYLNQQVK